MESPNRSNDGCCWLWESTRRAPTTLTLHYDRDLPMQIDGEAVRLKAEQFPLHMRIVTRLARVIDTEC